MPGKSMELNPSGRANTGLQRPAQHLGLIRKFLQCPMGKLPGARRWESDRILTGVKIKQKLWTKTQKPNNPMINALAISPEYPVIKICFDLKVTEPVGKRRRHRIGHSTVTLSIACGNDRPSFRHLVLPKSSIQN